MRKPSLWDDYRRKKRLGCLLFALYCPVMFIFCMVLQNIPGFQVLATLFFFCWMWFVGHVSSQTFSFPCPRCGKAFFRTDRYFNHRARQCLHCGLPKWTEAQRDASLAASIEVEAAARMLSGVWYATEERVFRWFKLFWHDDRGSFLTSEELLRFSGRRGSLLIPRSSSFELIGPVIPWGQVVLLLTSNVTFLLMVRAEIIPQITVDSPWSYLFLILADLAIIATWPLAWVKVEYRDEQGQPCTAYFTVGWLPNRWAGGVKLLFNQLRQQPVEQEY